MAGNKSLKRSRVEQAGAAEQTRQHPLPIDVLARDAGVDGGQIIVPFSSQKGKRGDQRSGANPCDDVEGGAIAAL